MPNQENEYSPNTNNTGNKPRFDEDLKKALKTKEIKNFTSELEEHSIHLRSIEQDLNDHVADIWDLFLSPISLEFNPKENISPIKLTNSLNDNLNKSFAILTSICLSANEVVTRARLEFYFPILMYGENDDENEEGEAQIQMGKFLGFLKKLSAFVSAIYELVEISLQQLSALCSNIKDNSRIILVHGIQFQVVYDHIAELLQVLITLDTIIYSQTKLKNHWKSYKNMLKSISYESDKFGMKEDQILLLDNLLLQFENQLLDNTIFTNCVKKCFSLPSLVLKNSYFAENFLTHIKQSFLIIDEKLGEGTEINERLQLIGLTCLFVLHQNIFQATDKKIFKMFIDTHKKIPCIVLTGVVIFIPIEFLLKTLNYGKEVADKHIYQTLKNSYNNYQQNLTNSLAKTESIQMGILNWMLQFDQHFSVHLSSYSNNLNMRFNLLYQGLNYMTSLKNLVVSLLTIHVLLKEPMTKSMVLNICRLIELLKQVQLILKRRSIIVVEVLMCLAQCSNLTMLTEVDKIHKRLIAEKPTEIKFEIKCAVTILLDILSGPTTLNRRLLSKLLVCYLMKSKILKDEEILIFQKLLFERDIVSSFHRRVFLASDCHFLYWHKSILPVYFSYFANNCPESYRLQSFLVALNDCLVLLKSIEHLEFQDKFSKHYQESILFILKDNLLDVISCDIETDLRLHTHSHLELDSRNPFRVGSKQLDSFVKLRPMYLFNRLIDVKAYIENYLSKTYYDLTAVALQDWKPYSEMRMWAWQKYKLRILETHLPAHSLEQGLDVLEIMRNIHVFVSKYLYNLNNQIFIEQSSNNKFLNSINIRHISNSIRTHGLGIMNTTVNFTYQFLAKKFFVFSQFLFDEHIKSKLIKSHRFFRENHLLIENKYPFEKAESFNRGIRKLGITPDGLSYLDQFRMLISQIGNAMGYIRMVRAGGLHCCGNAIRFIPANVDETSFEQLSQHSNVSPQTINASKHLDDVITNLYKNFAEGSDYFKPLVDVFSSEFQSKKNIHLKNFFIIIPSLTLNFIEHIIISKEKLTKKNKSGAAFTDDGFSMGLAYILKLLNQHLDFDSLHWFQSVNDKYQIEITTAREQAKLAKGDEKLQQTAVLTLKRLETYNQEFRLLYYSLSSARIFFQADSKDKATINEEQNDDSIKSSNQES